MLSIVQYHPMSLVQAGRAIDIADHMPRADVIALTGTRLRLPVGETSAVYRVGGFDHYVFGYGKGKLTNRAAGVSLFVRRSRFRRAAARQVYVPPPTLQGRAAALRLRTRFEDVCVAALYYAPLESGVAAGRCRAVRSALREWVHKLAETLPAR